MRFFAYQGHDSYGRPAQGTIQASSADEAGRLLQEGGVRVASVRELTASGAAPAQAPRPATPRPTAPRAPLSAPAPAVRPSVSEGAPRSPATPAAPASNATFPVRDLGNKASFFLFEAMARLLRSGIAPNRALEELSRQANKPWVSERLGWASGAVAAGMSLADALEACACFPTGAVGTLRAGEASGAVPDACLQAAAGCEAAHRLGTRCAAMTIMFFFVAVFAPIAVAFVHGSVDSMERQADANSSLPAASTAASSIGAQLGHMLPTMLPWWIVLFGGWRLWLTPRLRRARHRAVLLTPILAGRAREESLARASWALTELARAGMAPARSMLLAADACPNLIVADRFRDEAQRMGETTRLSSALRATGLMSPQLVDVVENGELAGDVPGAVSSVFRATGAEFERQNSTAHTKIWFVLYPILGVIIAVIVGLLYKTLYLGLFHAMLKDT